MQSLFEKYGPLTETYLPLDKTTNKPTGIGFVTFVMPEHAVKAFNELDGKVFQGRYLHILPSKVKERKEGVEGELIWVLWTPVLSSVKCYFLGGSVAALGTCWICSWSSLVQILGHTCK